MKQLFKKSGLIVLFLFCSLMSFAQGSVDQINNALKQGNVTELSRYFDNPVSLTLSGNQSGYSRSQAEMVLKDFFSRNTPKEYRMEHRGTNGNTDYVIGKMVTSSGTFRIYYALKSKNGKHAVLELRIEK